MTHSLPSSRARFQKCDWHFIESVLNPASERGYLQNLADDPESINDILDQRAIFQALLEQQGAVRVSAAFYFYIIVRQRFLQAGLDDRELADYVAAILAERVHANPSDAYRGIPGGFTHVSDFLAILDKASGQLRYLVQIAAGNQLLVLTGVFPEFLRHRRDRKGAPDLPFYEDFASRAFRDAANATFDKQDRHTLGLLSESFRKTRQTLNSISSDILFLHNS